MKTFTQIKIPPSNFKIDYNSNLFFLGSCFAENISKKFNQRKFNTYTNPFGVTYNPLSIERQILNIIDKKIFTKEDIFQDKNSLLWHSFEAHSSLSQNSQEISLSRLNEAIEKANKFLKKSDVVFITLGTSFVYFLKETNQVVSNCHKQPSNSFLRKLISVEDASNALSNIANKLHEFNKNLKIIFTVSPIRHLNDGMQANTISKSILQLSIYNLLQKDIPYGGYFPSYEIMMDELRDYRYYDDDMIHLSNLAEMIIFEKILNTYCSAETIKNVQQVEKFLKNKEHQILDLNSNRTHLFAKQCLDKISEFEKNISGIQWQQEKEYFKKLL